MNRAAKIMFGVVCVTLILVGYIAQTVCHLKLSYRILHYSKELSSLYEKHRRLEYKLAAFTSPSALEEQCARRRLNLAVPRAVKFFDPVSASRAPSRMQNAVQDRGVFKPMNFTTLAQAETSGSAKRG
ncbi:MAG: hypothetical protein PHE61_07970 [Candidatus Omnitrophica bacterium]|nr:hypothetical protein [Candidatus Omnitrophota bacterium]